MGDSQGCCNLCWDALGPQSGWTRGSPLPSCPLNMWPHYAPPPDALGPASPHPSTQAPARWWAAVVTGWGQRGRLGGSWVANDKGNQAARNYCWEVAGGRSKPPTHNTSLTKCKHNDKITKDFDRVLKSPAWDPSERGSLCDDTAHRPMKPAQHEEDEIRMAPAATDLRGQVNGLPGIGVHRPGLSDPLLHPWTLSSLI